MTTFAQSKQLQRIQSWYEPALYVMQQLLEHKRYTLRSGGYATHNAAVTKTEWRSAMAMHHGLSQYQIQEIEQSLYRACKISYFGRDYVELTNTEHQEGTS